MKPRASELNRGVNGCAWVVVAFLLAKPPLSGAPAPSLAGLQEQILSHISQPRFAAAAWGIKVVSLDTGHALFAHHAGKLLKPASNAKLYTAALALDRLGPDFRIRTSLYAKARPTKSGTLRGDLVVYGRGDPSLAARFNDGDYSKALEPLVDALVRAGVKRIQGDLVGDESFFRGPPLGSEWTWDDLQYYYGAEASALTVEDNVVDLVFRPGARVGEPCRIIPAPATPFLIFSNRTGTVAAGGPRQIDLYRAIGENVVYAWGTLPINDAGYTNAVTVHHAALWFVTLYREALARRGIRVAGKLRTIDWREREVKPVDYSTWVELGCAESRPLSEMLKKMMKPSQNLYAHLLLLQVGRQNAPAGERGQTTEEAGLAELRRFLGQAGIPPDEALLEEGSGLSRGALLTPNATVTLLRFMDHHRHALAFRESLPVAGVDGTLRRRLQHEAAAGKVQAKTGTLRYVHTLSGYLTSAAAERLAFSIMLNNYTCPEGEAAARADLDAIVLMLAESNARSATAPQ
jgi:D-alanyl-D-alanine carboxypeptidase/D-alanyl-D-alanine-endopeptidase (penicillin-binding protein 4)